MSDNEIFQHDTLEVNEHNEVNGSAYTYPFKGGYDVSASVHSYEYEAGKMNHVPIVTISDEKGSVVKEPYAHDSKDPEKAIENAKSVAKDVYENPETYIE